MAGPFKILACQIWIKPAERKPPATGEAIAVKAVQAGSSASGADAANLIDGSGLRDRDLDGLDEHASDPHQMWLSAKGETTGWLEFDLGRPQKLSTICIWNYNDTWHTDRGLRKADLAVWTPETGWRKLRDAVPFEQAEGSSDYDEPTLVELQTVAAQKVRFDNLVGLGDSDHIGLSEVQFFLPRGPAACRPAPRDGAEGVGLVNVRLAWAPGEGAAAHNVYLGTDPENLPLLGKVTKSEARLTRLADQTTYYWRADEIQPDGTTTQGRTWSFATSGLLAWWRLDESEGQSVADASVHGNTGTLVGDPSWQPAAGRVGGALELDGDDDHVRIDNEAEFDLTDEITVAAWVKVRAFDKMWQTIVAKGDHTWRLARDGDRDMLQFVAGSLNEDRIVLGNVNINDGKWHHVVGVADANRVSLYVDGALDNTQRARGKVPTDDQVVCLGENAMYPHRAWDGWLDEVCIFTYALDANEVQALYSGTEPTAIAARPAAAAQVGAMAQVQPINAPAWESSGQAGAAMPQQGPGGGNMVTVLVVVALVGLIAGASFSARSKSRWSAA